MVVNVPKLHQELTAAGIPIDGVAATEPPRIDFRAEATEEQRRLAAEIVAQHVPEDYQDKRRAAYVERGITSEAMTVALWEHVIEENSDGVNMLQALREDIKKQFPKVP